MKSIKLFVLLVAGFLCNVLLGQNVHYGNLLVDNDISCIDDNDGVLWVGTTNGLFIGKNAVWSKYSNLFLKDGPVSLAGIKDIIAYGNQAFVSTSSLCLCFNSDNGHSSEPLCYLNNRLIPSTVVGVGEVVYMYMPSFCSVFKYNFNSGQVALVKILGEPREYNFVNALHIPGTESSIYLFNNDGRIFLFDARNGSFQLMNGSPDYFAIKASAIDLDGTLWLASNELGLMHYRCDTDTHTLTLIESFNTSNSAISSNRIRSIRTSQDGVYVATAQNGLNIIRRNSTIEIYDNAFVRYLSFIHKTSKGNMLCVTEDKGLVYMKKSFVSSLSYSTLDFDHKLGDYNVLSLFHDSNNHCLWIGTEHGINRYDYESGKVVTPEHVRQPAVISMAEYDGNRLLVVCRNMGLMIFDKRTGKYSEFKSNSLKFTFASNNDFSNLKLSNTYDGEILIVGLNATNYLFNRANDTAKRFDFALTDRNESVVPILSLNSDQTLFKSESSIYELEISTMETRQLYECDSLISGVAFNGNSLMFAINNRIYSLTPNVNELREFMTVDMFDDISLVDMKFSTGNLLWIVDNQGGLLSLDTETKEITRIPSDMYRSNSFMAYPSLQVEDGTVVFTGTSGTIIVDSDNYNQSPVDKVSVTLNSIYLNDTIPVAPSDNYIKIPWSVRSVSCNIRLNDISSLSGVPIRYSLIKNSEVIDMKNTREYSYELKNVPAGKYMLTVSVRQSSGWSEPVGILKVQIMRNVFNSVLAICLYVVILIFCMILIICYIIKSHNNRKVVDLSKSDQNSDAAKIKLMTHIAHDIRSPLSLVYNPLRDIRDDNKDNPQLYKKLTRALVQVNKASRLATAAMNVQKLSQTEDTVQLVNLNLNEWLATLMLEFNVDCEARGLQLEFESESRIQSIKTDVTKVEVAVTNMLQNAIQSNNSGIIKVSTSFPSQRYIRISVADQGAGFEGDGESLFAFNPDRDAVEGFGIGLAYARKIVNKMNGRLVAEHNAAGGTTLNLDIPLFMSYAANQPSDVANSASQKQQTATDFAVTPKKMVLLIVDDQQDVLDFIKEELEDKFKKIVTAHNGIEALVQIDYYHPDAIVSDIMMPQMNGFELCQSLKTNVKISHLPIIALSSKTEAANQITFFKNGPDDFIGKPFDVNHLYSVVVSHIAKRAQIKEDYKNGVFTQLTTQYSFSAADDKFIVKLQDILNKNKCAESVDISELGNTFNMSSKEVSQKIENLVGVDFSKYIKKYYTNEK
ncbi:MAG: response regulator [Bacteroidaceae bacterium]|nr:response regulator [Bacteroidaceae bacterium]